MKRQLTPAEKHRRVRRLILFGIPAASLLWAGCQRMAGFSDEYWYCHRLRYHLLADYQMKHHQWPTSLDDVERDVEANAYVDPSYMDYSDNSDFIRTFQRFRPVMTVTWKTQDEIQINVRFTQRVSFESGVEGQSMLSDTQQSEPSRKNE